ncbi:hypothetical protein AXF42_Ash020299 [Apostasia shenzhenica]|uniref:Uncharacterized protein n=1 Tax=Apostasia shenzhenica TaxID=1088818 RepID=A0A2H9ZSZ5_9ASPA|nr:hypothetical protein AXF42_Ash020299 [Apostasia shenzhenica]
MKDDHTLAKVNSELWKVSLSGDIANAHLDEDLGDKVTTNKDTEGEKRLYFKDDLTNLSPGSDLAARTKNGDSLAMQVATRVGST